MERGRLFGEIRCAHTYSYTNPHSYANTNSRLNRILHPLRLSKRGRQRPLAILAVSDFQFLVRRRAMENTLSFGWNLYWRKIYDSSDPQRKRVVRKSSNYPCA